MTSHTYTYSTNLLKSMTEKIIWKSYSSTVTLLGILNIESGMHHPLEKGKKCTREIACTKWVELLPDGERAGEGWKTSLVVIVPTPCSVEFGNQFHLFSWISRAALVKFVVNFVKFISEFHADPRWLVDKIKRKGRKKHTDRKRYKVYWYTQSSR